MILASLACTLVVLAGFFRIYWLNCQLRALTLLVIQRSERLETVVNAARQYRDHGTASTWRGVLAQLERFEASEPPRCPPGRATH